MSPLKDFEIQLQLQIEVIKLCSKTEYTLKFVKSSDTLLNIFENVIKTCVSNEITCLSNQKPTTPHIVLRLLACHELMLI